MKKLLLLTCFFSFLLAGSAFAEGRSKENRFRAIDMAKVTCSEALQIKDARAKKALVIWSDGYLSAKKGNTIVDIHQLENLAGQLEMHCRSNPSMLFIDAVRKSKKTKSLLSFFSRKEKKKDRYSNIDMSKVTCLDAFKEKDRQVLKAVIIWIDGYLSAKTGDTIVDVYKLQNIAERLESSCRTNPSMLLLDAVKKLKKSPPHTDAALKGGRQEDADPYSNVEMTKVTCGEVLQIRDSQTQKALVIWVDGYLSAKSGNTTVDVHKLQDLAERLEGYCRDNPSVLLLKAVKKY